MNNDTKETTFPIDAVITWVDGNDPAHKAARYKYSHNGKEFKYEDVASDVRYTSLGEIKYCVASFLRFAPWIRKIYLLTPGQDPHLEDFLNKNFPNRTTEIEIVNQEVVFRGYEQCLPVFNSLSVETVVWRIPGLSEHYIYSNDDFFLARPCKPSDFFRDGKLVAYVRPYRVSTVRIKKFFRSLLPGHHVIKWRYCMGNAAKVVGEKKRFPHIRHIPMAQMKSLFEKFYADHEDVMIKNMNCRFREMHQYHSQVLSFLLAERQNLIIELYDNDYALYVHPKPKRGKDYFKKKLEKFDQNTLALFGCFNSLDRGSEKDKKMAFDWIRRRLNVED